MNILNKINKEINLYEFKYFGPENYASYFELEDVLNNSQIIEDYYKSKSYIIKNFDDYVDYLFVKKFSQFNDIILCVNEDKQQQVKNILEVIKEFYFKYKNKDVIKYLNDNYKDIIDKNEYNFREATLFLAFNFYSGCTSIIEYYIDNYCYLIIYNFDKIQNVLLKNDALVDKLFDKKHFDEIKFSGLNYFLSILAFFIKKGKKGQIIDDTLKYISNFADEIYSKINDDTILQYDNLFKTLVDFFIDIKYKNANEYESKFKLLEVIRNSYLKKHGQEFSFEIPLDKIEEYVNDQKLSLQHKIFLLTHVVRGGKVVSFLADIGAKTKKSLVDVTCSTTTPHDDYFTISKQEHLSLFVYVMNTIIQYFVNKEKIQDFISNIAAITEHICKNLNVDLKDTEFKADYNVLLNMFVNIFNAHETKNEYLVTGMNYGISMFIFGLTEKILRIYYKSQKKERYIKEDWYSMGHLLDVNDNIMVNLFGVDHLRVLGYFLTNGSVGYNLRNNFAHYKNIKQKDIHWGATLLSLYLYIDILNQILIKFNPLESE